MKIVQIAPYYSPHIGGVETHIKEVNKILVQQKHKVVVLTTQHDRNLPLEETIDGVLVIRLPKSAMEKKIPTWKWLWSQRGLLQSVDVIQVHDIFWWMYPVLPLISSKVFTTFHGWETQYPVRWQAKVQRWLASQLSQATMHVGDWIQEFYWDKSTAVTYGGVEDSKLPSQTFLNINNLHFVFLGRLSSENEIAKYAQLMTLIKKEFPKTKLTWVGDGPLKNTAKKIGEVTGFVNDPKKYIQQADVVFASSYLAILEAQQQGRVVCAFYSHSLKQRYLETYPGSEYMLIESEVEVMKERLLELLENKKRVEEIEHKARQFAQKQTWDKVTELYQHLWQQK